MLIGKNTGEISRQELADALKRDDIILAPHDTYHLDAGADFSTIDPSLYTPLLEIYSRGDSAEYFGTPYNISDTQCEGGFWQDALKRGAKMSCFAGSDDHACKNRLIVPEDYNGSIAMFPDITGVLAEEITLGSIFSALKARRCYGFMGGRIRIDFRINGHYMGEEFFDPSDRTIYYKTDADAEIKRVTLVKNSRDYIYLTLLNSG